jgi:glutathione S-transferase
MYTLFTANRNYSSWSLRAWLALKATDISFTERKLELFTDAFARETLAVNPLQQVPVLLDDDFAVWESLAIVEYLAERHPDAGLWPVDGQARARARTLCASMHAGFGQLRQHMPMNVEASLPGKGQSPAVQADIDRVQSLWDSTRQTYGADGLFLFGSFTAADAFFAPVVSRFETYAVPTTPESRAYMDAVLALPAMRQWVSEARAEANFVPQDEPYRTSR